LTATLSSIATPGTDYDFVVVAINDAGTSPQSGVLQARAADAPQTPATPTKVLANGTTITIEWAAVTFSGYSPLVGYKVYWNGGGTGALLTTPVYDTASPLVLTHTINTGLSPGQQYQFAISAYNAYKESTKSPILTLIAATVPAKPDPVFRSGSGTTSITFSWVAPYDGQSPITGYSILWNSGSGTVFTSVGTTGAATTSFTKSSLVNG